MNSCDESQPGPLHVDEDDLQCPIRLPLPSKVCELPVCASAPGKILRVSPRFLTVEKRAISQITKASISDWQVRKE